MQRKIKKPEEVANDGIPQFIVLERHKVGIKITYKIVAGFEREDIDADNIDVNVIEGSIVSPDENFGVIKIIQRISDSLILTTGEMVFSEDSGSAFLIQFDEDLIHCTVAPAFVFVSDGEELKKTEIVKIEVNSLDKEKEISFGLE